LEASIENEIKKREIELIIYQVAKKRVTNCSIEKETIHKKERKTKLQRDHIETKIKTIHEKEKKRVYMINASKLLLN
jgi:hypothetical protein